MKLRPGTGPSFVKSCAGKVAFLRRGLTTAVLKPSGTQLSMSEQLTNFVIDGYIMSLHSLIRNVGQGSNIQDFVGESLMILSTVS